MPTMPKATVEEPKYEKCSTCGHGWIAHSTDIDAYMVCFSCADMEQLDMVPYEAGYIGSCSAGL